MVSQRAHPFHASRPLFCFPAKPSSLFHHHHRCHAYFTTTTVATLSQELAFRKLCRELDTDLCYTPMLHARLFCEVPAYREAHFDADPSDEPVVAQLAGHDPAVVLQAARMIEPHVNAVDLNFGCPQGIARKGRYGAFLLDEPDVMVSLVETLASHLSVPVTAKLRLLPSRDESLVLCRRLADAGASAVTLHGRTRTQNKQHCGGADWDAIGEVVRALDVPVIANGGIATRTDVDACLEHTGAAAVMSSEALLENPALFCSNRHPATSACTRAQGFQSRTRSSPPITASVFFSRPCACSARLLFGPRDVWPDLDQHALARAYLGYAAAHPPTKGAGCVRGHLFKILHHGLRVHHHLRDELLLAQSLAQMSAVIDVRHAGSALTAAAHSHSPARRHPRPSTCVCVCVRVCVRSG